MSHDHIHKHSHDEGCDKPCDFDHVFKAELRCIRDRRLKDDVGKKSEAVPRGRGLPDFSKFTGDKERGEVFSQIVDELKENQDAWDRWIDEAEDGDISPERETWSREEREAASGLTGLALSGGGIRSATFNLGVVQLLHRCGLFTCLDYLSTVSGGGYLGACISSSLNTGNHRLFKHKPGKPEPLIFRHLRNNSRYLAPDGFRDYFRIPAVLLRGVLINLFAAASMLAVLAAVFSAALRLMGYTVEGLKTDAPWWPWPLYITTGAFVAYTAVYLVLSGMFSTRVERKGNGYAIRDRVERRFANMLIATAIAAGLSVLPIALGYLEGIRTEGGFQAFVASIAGIFTTVSLFADKIGISPSRIAKKGVMLLALFSGVILLVLAFLFMTLIYLEHGWTGTAIGAGAGVVATAILLLCWNINLTGMHNFYRDRLSKAYVVAEKNPEEDNTSGAVRLNEKKIYRSAEIIHNNNLKLSELKADTAPYHIINAAVNLKEQTEKFQKGRKADNFIFSRLHTGAPIIGYCPTGCLEEQNSHVNLATAMAVSGAAAAPNMGKSTNRFVAIILTLFNIRLNYWMRSPWTVCSGGTTGLRRLTDRGLVQFLFEIAGSMKEKDRLVNLSDGGHFDNSALYELIRRECRFIVFGDGECDPTFQFEALAHLTRMALIDFGVKITFDGLDEIREGQSSHAVGTIFYPGGRIGKLLYLKSNLSGDYNLESTLKGDAYVSSPLRDDNRLYNRSAYIANYKASHPDFPHESTSDQFFDETQFECYRALGYEVASRALVKPQ